MIRTQVYIPDDLYRELMLLAKREKTNFSRLIREAAQEVVKKKTKKRKVSGLLDALIGACKTRVKTDAVKMFHDYYRNDVV